MKICLCGNTLRNNGNSFILDEWISNCDLEPYTDSAGGGSKGCGAYCKSK